MINFSLYSRFENFFKMNLVVQICALFVIAFAVGSVNGLQNGATMSFNKLALEVVHDVFINHRRNALLNRKVPTVEREKYMINFEIQSIETGTCHFDTIPPNAITIKVDGERYEVLANWKYFGGEEELSGTTLITINGINVNHLMLFDLNENNSPKLLPGPCTVSIDEIKLDLQIEDPATTFWLRAYEDEIKEKAEAKICNVTLEEMLQYLHFLYPVLPDDEPQLKPLFPIFPNVRQNVALTEVPEVTEDGIIFALDGKVFSTIHNPDQIIPFEPTPPPSLQSSRQMVQLVLSDYVFESLNLALFQNGQFDEVDPIAVVNQRFGSDLSVNGLAKEFPQLIPFMNSSIDFVITGTAPPRAHFNSTGIFATEFRKLSVRATMDNSTEAIVLSFDYFNDFEIQFYVLDDAIYLRIAEIDSIPLEDTPAARFFSRFRAKYNPNYLTWANGALSQVPYILPQYGPFGFEHISIKLLEDGIDIAGDLGTNTISNFDFPPFPCIM